MPSEYRAILYLILKVLNRPLKWDTARFWTPPGSAFTSRQSWTLFVLVVKQRFFSNVQLWRLVEADPVGIQRRAVSHFKGLFKTFKMRYSTFLYSYWIGLHVHFKNAILNDNNNNGNIPLQERKSCSNVSKEAFIEKSISILFLNFSSAC